MSPCKLSRENVTPRCYNTNMKQEVITLKRKQLRRYEVILQTLNGSMTIQQAADALNLSARQIKRLKKEVASDGAAALVHKNSLKRPANAISQETVDKIIALKQSETFKNANFIHFRELLDEHYDIHISYSALYKILSSKGIRSPKKRRRFKPHRRRSRKPQAGLLVQVDATSFRWFKGNRKMFALHGVIDDATGQVLALYMTKTECLMGYFEMTKRMIENFGIPVSMYADRHTIFRSPLADKADVDSDKDINDTQFGRALRELGIELIAARSPQAKGRIERLWETLQSRLPVEFMLHGIEDLDSANEFLRTYIYTFNSQFAVEPADTNSLFCPADEIVNLDYILCIKDSRKVDAGGVFSYNGKSFKLVSNQYTMNIYAGTTINVLSHPRYGVKAQYCNVVLEVLPFIPVKRTPKAKVQDSFAKSQAHTVSSSHPWRNTAKIPVTKYDESWQEICEMVNEIFAAKY